MQTQTHYRSGQLGPCKSFTRKKKTKHRPCSDFTLQSPQIRSKCCRGRACNQAWDPARAEHRCRTKALVRTKADTLGVPLGPNPCQGADEDQHRHARESTRASYGCNAQAPARTKAARLACPLGIPLGPSTGATQGKSKGKRSHARDPARDPARAATQSVTLAEAIQLAHGRPSCASFGRLSQGFLHHACQPASLLQ